MRAVDAHGKHLFVRFDGGLTIHSHLRMTGAWGVHPPGRRWKRARHRAWLVLERSGTSVVQFDVTGHPALSLPVPGNTGLPIGFQVIGRHLDDGTVLRVGSAVESL